jgi:hypothetical protein
MLDGDGDDEVLGEVVELRVAVGGQDERQHVEVAPGALPAKLLAELGKIEIMDDFVQLKILKSLTFILLKYLGIYLSYV